MNFEERSTVDDPRTPFDDTDTEQNTEGAEPDGPFDRLLDGDCPGPATDELQREYGLSRDQSILGRGILRVATGSGVPPVFEIVFGALMWVINERSTVDTSQGTELSDDPLEPGDLEE